MKITYFKLISLLLLLLFQGCVSTSGSVTIDPVKTLACLTDVKPDLPTAEETTIVPVPKPSISKEQYLALEPSQKERVLTNYSVQLLGALGEANDMIKVIDKWRINATKQNTPSVTFGKSDENLTKD